VSLGPSLLPHPREIPIIRDETQIESMDGEKKRTGRRKRGDGNEGETGWESAVPGKVERKLRGGRRKLESFWNGG